MADIHKLFNEEIPAALEKNPKEAKEVGGKFQFIVTGEGGGEWFLDLSETGPRAEKGNPGGSDCVIKIEEVDFQKLLEDPQKNGMQLFFGGKLKVDGNQMLAMKLPKLFALKA